MSGTLRDKEDSLVIKCGETLFERTLEALPDGVLINDSARRVIYTNPAFARHWGIPPEIIQGRDDLTMLTYIDDKLEDAESFRSEVERIHLTKESTEDEITLRDERIFSRRSVPFEEDGVVKGRIWIFSDVTDARHSLVDSLTGLPNRRAYSRDFPQYTRAEDDGLLRSVAIVDIDNFKSFNDIYGHAAGDSILLRIGQIMRFHFSGSYDLAFRIGGEEFLLASKARTVMSAFTFFDHLRRSVSEMGVPHAGNAPHKNVTVSMGLGTFRTPKPSGFVFDQADAALYQAKSSGRNVIVPISF